MGDYVGDPYPYAKFHNDPITPFVLQMRENLHQVTRLVFFGFFRQRIAKTPAPIFTINTSNDVASRKDVPFGGLENQKFIFRPHFFRVDPFIIVSVSHKQQQSDNSRPQDCGTCNGILVKLQVR